MLLSIRDDQSDCNDMGAIFKRPAWCTYRVPGQLARQYSEILSQRKKQINNKKPRMAEYRMKGEKILSSWFMHRKTQ